MKSEKMPQTDSIQELARFWDTHDLADYDDQLLEIPGPVFEGETVIPIHLPSREAQALRQIAKDKGIGEEHVIREWVLERISEG